MSQITGTGDGTVKGMQAILKDSPELQELFKKDPVKAMEIFVNPLQSDEWVYRIVVGALGFAIVLAVIGSIVLTALDKTSPELLVAIGSAAVGALAGLLAPSPTKK